MSYPGARYLGRRQAQQNAYDEAGCEHRDGNDCVTNYDAKRTQGPTGRAALRSLKRRISDAIYRRLVTDAARRS